MADVTVEQLEIIVRAKIDEAINPLNKVIEKLKEISSGNFIGKTNKPLEQTAQTARAVSDVAVQGASKMSQAYSKLQTELEFMQKAYDNINKQVEDMFGAGVKPEQYNQFKEMGDVANNLYIRIDKANSKLKEMKYILDAAGESSNSFQQIGSAIENISPKIKEAANQQNEYTRAIKKSTQATIPFAKSILKVSNMLKLMLIRQAIRQFFKAFNDGISDMAKAVPSVKNTMGGMATGLLSIRNGIVVALYPAIMAILPVIEWLGNAFIWAGNAIAEFWAKLTGAGTFVKSTKAITSYGGAIDKAGSAAKKALAPFDELNTLAEQTGGGGAGGGGAVPADMFEEVEVTSRFTDMINKFKDALDPTIQALGRLKDALEPFKTFVFKGLLDFYYLFLVPVGKWILGEGLPRLIDGMTRLAKEIDWQILNESLATLWVALAPFAITIGEGLLWFYEEVLVPLGIWLANNVLPTAFDLISGAVTGLTSVLKILGNILKPIWENIFKPLGSFLGAILEPALEGVRKGAKNVSEAFKIMSEWVGINKGKLDDFLKPVKEWIDKAADWVRGNETLNNVLRSLGEILGIVATSIGVVIGVKTTWAVITGTATAVTTALGAAIALLTSPITLVVLAIAGIIAIVVLLIQHWDDLKAAGARAWEGIKGTWEDVAEWFNANVTSPLAKDFKLMVNFLVGMFEGLANGFIKAINFIINAMNKINFDVPDWVPGIGGKSFGISIPRVSEVKIPRLARGAVLSQPTVGLMAEYSGARTNPEIVAPESKLTEIFVAQLANFIMPLLNATEEQTQAVVEAIRTQNTDIILNGTNLAREMNLFQIRESSRIGNIAYVR